MPSRDGRAPAAASPSYHASAEWGEVVRRHLQRAATPPSTSTPTTGGSTTPPSGSGAPAIGPPYTLTVTRPVGRRGEGGRHRLWIHAGTLCAVTMPGPMTIGLQATPDSGYVFAGLDRALLGQQPECQPGARGAALLRRDVRACKVGGGGWRHQADTPGHASVVSMTVLPHQNRNRLSGIAPIASFSLGLRARRRARFSACFSHFPQSAPGHGSCPFPAEAGGVSDAPPRPWASTTPT